MIQFIILFFIARWLVRYYAWEVKNVWQQYDEETKDLE